MREEDEISLILPARTLHMVLFFSDKGKVYAQKAFQIPEGGRTDKGVPVINVLALEASERITAAVAVPDFAEARYCTLGTVNGKVKRVALGEFASVRPSGLIAATIEKNDRLLWARLTSGHDDLLLVTAQGRALRFNEAEVRPTGRQAAGVNGIHLKRGDSVASMEVVEPEAALLVATERGYGKRTPLEEYPTKGRAGGGMLTIDPKSFDLIGPIVSARVVKDEDEITLITVGGQALRLRVNQISVSSRATRGVHLIHLGSDDSLLSIARLRPVDLNGKDAPPSDISTLPPTTAVSDN
jgi:DNA gyrase subunit A